MVGGRVATMPAGGNADRWDARHWGSVERPAFVPGPFASCSTAKVCPSLCMQAVGLLLFLFSFFTFVLWLLSDSTPCCGCL